MAIKALKVTTAVNNPISSGTILNIVFAIQGNNYVNIARQQDTSIQLECKSWFDESTYDDLTKEPLPNLTFDKAGVETAIPYSFNMTATGTELATLTANALFYGKLKAALESLGLTVTEIPVV